jgi:hypothetical protein
MVLKVKLVTMNNSSSNTQMVFMPVSALNRLLLKLKPRNNQRTLMKKLS